MRQQGSRFLAAAIIAIIAFAIIGVIGAFPDRLLFSDFATYASVHTLMVAFSFAVCALIFGSGWYTASDGRSGVMAFLSATFLAVGLLDLGHILSFPGMPDFVTPSGGDKPLAFWLAARYAGAVPLLLVAMASPEWRVTERQRYLFLAGALLYVAIVYSVTLFHPSLVPPLFIEGQGLTPLKKGAEYGVVAIHLATVAVLARRGTRSGMFALAPLLWAVILLTASEVAFTLYRLGYDNFNVIGHVYKVIAFALIYRVVFVGAVTEPYRLRAESERRYRELAEELRRSEAHFQRAQRIGHIGSIDNDIENGRVHWSPEMYAILGLAETPVQPGLEVLSACLHPQDRAKFAAARERDFSEAGPEPTELRFVRPGGEVRWVLRRAEPIRAADGSPAKVMITYQDITDFKLIADALRDSERLLRETTSTAGIGIFDHNMVTGTIYWSPEQRQIFGLGPDEVITLEMFLEFVHPDDRDRVVASVQRAHDSAGDGLFAEEHRVVRRDGSVRWVKTRGETLFEGEGTARRAVRATGATHDVTDAKEIERRLRLNRDHLARAQRIGHIGSAETDLESGQVTFSDELFSLLGLAPAHAEESFETVLAMALPEDRAKLAELRDRDLAGKETEPAEIRFVRPDGEVRWTLRRSELVRAADGRGARLVVTLEDITDRKRIADALEQSEQLLREATRAASIGVYIRDIVTDRNYWSPEQRRIFGVRDDQEITSAVFFPLLHEEDRPVVLAAVQRAHDPKGDGRLDLEYRIVRPDGDMRWLKSRGHTIFEGKGEDRRAVRAVGAVFDITEAKQTEERIRRSEAHLARAQAVGRVGSAEVDIRTGEYRRSEQYYRILGLEPSSKTWDRSDFLEAILPEDRGAILPYDALIDYKGPIPTSDFRVRRRNDGEVRWVQRHAEVLRDGEGKPVSLMFTLQDITDSKREEETRQALERQLGQAQKMEAVGQLTGGIAHDFNNLLAVIIGRLQLLEEELTAWPALAEWARICIRAAERGASLTRSLLAFSRMQQLNPASIDLNAIVEEMTTLLRRTLGETIDIRVLAAPELWRCLADPGQVQNAILNLALNARDAMPDGGILTLQTANATLDGDYADRNRDAVPGEYAVLSVSDTGVGMPPDVVQRAFEPFFTTKGVGKGSGLGLSMVYGFAKQSGGHVSLYSEIGHGTTVKLYLPRTTGAAAGEGKAAEPAPLARGAETILVVEDNDDLRELTQAQLERLGYQVLAAGDASRGLELLREHPEASVLLSDVVLAGGLSGPRLADEALALRPDLGVLFMTGYSGQTATDAVARFGMDRLLPKPFHQDDLARLIRWVIDRESA